MHKHFKHTRGETLPEDQQIYRVCVVHVFLHLNKLSYFRSLLEENALRLTDKRQMTQEQASLIMEISNQYLSIIFERTTRFGEAMAIVVRDVDNDCCIQQGLISFKLLPEVNDWRGNGTGHHGTLSGEYSILPNRRMRDRAVENSVAVRLIKESTRHGVYISYVGPGW